ncbi:MAG: phosphate ABC transporter permease subunit PstC [Deferribacteraceae bacterium]|jgi:phosphate transport system permease protein|nr:phosphate ABC transporter permease subunit PstC [Deferribacteraceae bacterium]
MKMFKNHSLYINYVFRAFTAVAAFLVIVIIFGIFVTLLMESLPAIKEFGFIRFMTGTKWDPVNNIYAGGRPLFGTMLTTLIALAVAVPVAIGIAIFLTELCPPALRQAIGTAIELLAAIPSIIYGMWGLFVFAPILESTVQPFISGTLGFLPVIGSFFRSGYAGGVNLFTTSIVLAVMVIPFIASITRDTFMLVPPILKESAYGVGATRWEVIKDVIIPYSKIGVAGGIIIATGRALGETMAVAYVIGNRHGALDSIFSPYTTITSVLANEFSEASGIQMSSLFLMALILFIANLMVLSLAKFILRKDMLK